MGSRACWSPASFAGVVVGHYGGLRAHRDIVLSVQAACRSHPPLSLVGAGCVACLSGQERCLLPLLFLRPAYEMQTLASGVPVSRPHYYVVG